jgi:hypothetical protein
MTQKKRITGLEDVQQKGSSIFREGTHMLPNCALMMAEGLFKTKEQL